MTPPKNVRSFNVPPRVMMDHMKINEPNKYEVKSDKEAAKYYKNLFSTEAGAEAMRLDNLSGADGKITAKDWNDYVRGLFTDPEEAKKHEIQNEITVVDAMNSIATYKAQLQAKSNKPDMGLNSPAATPEKSEAKQPARLPDITSQVEDDGKRHYYKKDPSQGEAGWTEVPEEEYNELRARWEGGKPSDVEPQASDNDAAQAPIPDVTKETDENGKTHYYKKDPSQGEAGYIEITQKEYDEIRAKWLGEA